MKNIEIDITNESSLAEACQKVLDLAGDIKVFALDAPMGAGKTTLIKQFAKTLGSQDHFSSPTYSIVNEYISPKGKIFHFDLYRLKNSSELLDLGFEEYADGENYCFIEWPGLALDLISGSYVEIKLKLNQNKRYLYAHTTG